ncbi:NADH dehydrogenase [Noviherbaspirillum humi]|uniref:NADH dehydrogenase n=1 Tax=Noviherbaspirillum humi TaxID=1688639 RepID=A0A239G560_9BURK|nr:NAD(P)/FAD-dependent oxidoreductase [Noviherbaspirillum humi]SNS63613.1 NADH dehydrogenase [Noviherbaspirillum humi]
MNPSTGHRIVIVGGGAGGLELATRLGDKLGRKGRAEIVLVDRSPTHLWKPLLHEVAAGSLDIHAHQVEYIAQARWHHFEFQQGALIGLDRERKQLRVAASLDEDGIEILPEREIAYDTLVLAIGSVTNFFNTTGAAEHAIALDTVPQAERFRRRLIAACMRAQNRLGEHAGESNPQVDVVIIGGGATGVELSAELRNTAQVLRAYGLHQLDPVKDVKLTVIEAGPRLLGPLPERVSKATTELLHSMNIGVMTSERVTEVREDAVLTQSGKRVPADLVVWAAGIKAPEVLSTLGLPLSRLGQVEVKQTLQTPSDSSIFAFGDCASCPSPDDGKPVPPRAQAAHQQAAFLFKALQLHLAGKPLPEFKFSDLGSLVSLGRVSAVGNLMGNLVGGSLLIDGLIARVLYASLYRMHVLALRGAMRMVVDTVVQWLRQRTTPRVKLH